MLVVPLGLFFGTLVLIFIFSALSAKLIFSFLCTEVQIYYAGRPSGTFFWHFSADFYFFSALKI
jgi:hypothetical protein